jgi:hypothetical protein
LAKDTTLHPEMILPPHPSSEHLMISEDVFIVTLGVRKLPDILSRVARNAANLPTILRIDSTTNNYPAQVSAVLRLRQSTPKECFSKTIMHQELEDLTKFSCQDKSPEVLIC